MRPSHVRLVLAALVAATLAAPASAAPRSCNLLLDPRGDGTVAEPALDVVGGDVASNAREITVAIRVADLTDTRATSPAGADYTLSLRIGETRLQFLAALSLYAPPRFRVRPFSSAGNTSLWAELPGADASSRVRGVVDVVRDEIRITVPLADLARYGATRRGARAYDLLVRTWRTVPLVVDTVIVSDDDAAGDRSYALGSPSCLAVGQ